MKLLILALTFLSAQVMPKNNPNGIWEAESGSQYQFVLMGSDLHVKLVAGSNPRFVQYEVDLKNQEEINTYKGTGFFVAKMSNGKECKVPTEWNLVVVSNDRIIGLAESVTADQETCQILQKDQIRLDLKKKK
jgi:hypothetical protein